MKSETAHSTQAAETLTYTYYARGRLKQVQTSGGLGNGAIRAYQFDAGSNRTQFQSTAAFGGSTVAIAPGSAPTAPRSYTFTITVRDLRWLPAVLELLLEN